MKIDILGVQIDQVNMDQAVSQVMEWVKKGGKHYIVTPNVEIIMAAQKDVEFRKILNEADLAIPDSARIGWAKSVLNEKNPILKFLKWKLFLFPTLGRKSFGLFPQLFQFDIVTGTDLMEQIIKVANDKGFTIGLLGGREKVAERLGKVLKVKYPELKVTFIDSGGIIDQGGNQVDVLNSKYYESSDKKETHNTKYIIPNTDILFVAFGHIKQEKWISKNLEKYPVKVMMGVGGAFDYLYGGIPRAPKILRSLGLEWIFRLLVQPWRIKRFGALVEFLFLILTK